MDEEDIYGEDIYGNPNLQYAQPETGAHADYSNTARGPQDEEKDQLIRDLQEKLTDQDQKLADLQAQLENMTHQARQWNEAYKEVEAKVAAGGDQQKLHAELDSLRQRDATMQMQIAEQHLENLELRRALHSARQASDPHIAQVRQLLLDPAVAREFERLRAEVEVKAGEVKSQQDELQAVNFSQESKTGRLLMAKCRSLQTENEDMGREMAEGKMHAIEQQAALARSYAEDMRKLYTELEEHTMALDEEAGVLNTQVHILTRPGAMKNEPRDGDFKGRPGPPPGERRVPNSARRPIRQGGHGGWSTSARGPPRQDHNPNLNRGGDRQPAIKRPR